MDQRTVKKWTDIKIALAPSLLLGLDEVRPRHSQLQQNKRNPVSRIDIKQNGQGQQQQKLKKIKTSWTMTTGIQQPWYFLLLVM
jgi:hypothetical protein